MIAKEWLEDIKERFAKYEYDYNLNGEDVEWLIQQAERAQELEKENRRYRKIINDIIEKAMLFGVDEQVFEAIKEAIRVLEGEE
jgi:septation ring formation regulator EzrA